MWYHITRAMCPRRVSRFRPFLQNYKRNQGLSSNLELNQSEFEDAVGKLTSGLIYHLLSVLLCGWASVLMRPYSKPWLTFDIFREARTSSTRTNASSSVFMTYLAETTCVCQNHKISQQDKLFSLQKGKEMKQELTPKMQIAIVFQVIRL